MEYVTAAEFIDGALHAINSMDYNAALQIINEGIEQYPLTLNMYSLAAYINSKVGHNFESYINAVKAERMSRLYGQEPLYREKIAEILNEMPAVFDNVRKAATLEAAGLFTTKRFKESGISVIGKYVVTGNNLHYIGQHQDWTNTYFRQGISDDSTTVRCEIMRVLEGVKEYKSDRDCVLSIAIKGEEEVLLFNKDGAVTEIKPDIPRQFNHYRVPKDTIVRCSGEMVVAEPGNPPKNPSRKPLVLNIFVDSITQESLKGSNLEIYMPNTYRFFRDGIIFDNVYSAAECTLPGVATITTGLYPSRHMLTHYSVSNSIPIRHRSLFEYFDDVGYYTAKIGGNASISADFGYLRGVRRAIYQYYMPCMQVVECAIDQMEMAKNTDLFLWLEFMELHSIAKNYSQAPSTQAATDYRCRHIDNSGVNSVLQSYSPNKERIFYNELRHIDTCLSLLYGYLNANYSGADVIITFFSDHGSSFMIRPEDNVMGDRKTKVPLMIRSGFARPSAARHCSEIISMADYLHILCYLAGIDMDETETNGILPRKFGGVGRAYAISENVYPKEQYRLALHYNDYDFYLLSDNNLSMDCRITLDRFSYELRDKSGKTFEDTEKTAKCLFITREHIGRLKYDLEGLERV